MRQWNVLHLVGDNATAFQARQLAAQITLLPQPRFVQRIAAVQRTAPIIESTTLRKTIRLDRRWGSDLLVSRQLRRVLKEWTPQLVVCWDIPATDQLRYALLGTRLSVAVVVMAFAPPGDRNAALRLQSNAHSLTLHSVASSEVLVDHLQREMNLAHRVYRIAPHTGPAGLIDRPAIRRQLGLPASGPVVFLSRAGRMHDHKLGLWGCAMVRRLFPELKVLMPVSADDGAMLGRYRRFAEHVVDRDMLVTCDQWADHLAVAASDVYLEPMTVPGQALGILSALAGSVPVVASSEARYTLGQAADQITHRIAGTNARAVGSAVLKLLEDDWLRQELVGRAEAWSSEHGSDLRYRADVVRVYDQILEQRWRPTVGDNV